jgi:hypothetical protein
MTHRDYPSVTCTKHGVAPVFLVDVVSDDGSLVQHCPRCIELGGDRLELGDVVRQLYNTAMRGAVK